MFGELVGVGWGEEEIVGVVVDMDLVDEWWGNEVGVVDFGMGRREREE